MNQPLKPRSFFTVSLSVLLATFATALGAQSVEAAKPMALRTIMERLGRDMQAVTGAISKEDWPLVAELAACRTTPCKMPHRPRILRA